MFGRERTAIIEMIEDKKHEGIMYAVRRILSHLSSAHEVRTRRFIAALAVCRRALCDCARAQCNEQKFPVYGVATTLEKWVFIEYKGRSDVVFSARLTLNLDAADLAAEFAPLAQHIVWLTHHAAKGARKAVRGAAACVRLVVPPLMAELPLRSQLTLPTPPNAKAFDESVSGSSQGSSRSSDGDGGGGGGDGK